MFDFAKTFFEQQKNTNTDIQAEKYYYLGLISIAENTDSASLLFDKAIAANAKSPCYLAYRNFILEDLEYPVYPYQDKVVARWKRTYFYRLLYVNATQKKAGYLFAGFLAICVLQAATW